MSEHSVLLEVQNLKTYFPIRGGLMRKAVGYVHAVEDVSFTIREQETFGLVGESGCGKSTTGRTILRLIEPTGGQILFQGSDLCALGQEAMRRRRRDMQLVFQDPYASLNPRMTVRRLLEKQPAGDVPVGEIQEIAPILHTDQVETLLGDTAGKPIDADAIASLAPYLSQSFIDDCAEKLLQANGSLHAIAKLAPFVSTSFLDEKAEEALRQTGSLDAIRAVAPFLSEALLDRLAETAFWETGRLSSFSAVTPFVSTAVLNRIAVEVLRQDGPRGIAPLLPFVDSRILVDYLNGALNE